MHIIKLNAIDSTNTYLKTISTNSEVQDYLVVTAKEQTKGKGQRGNVWESERSKNLMCSIFKTMFDLDIKYHFYISIVTSLAIVAALKKLQIPKLYIKWPNDILSENKKIAGILIENIIKINALESSIIGIGLNINQTNFETLPRASSLKLITGHNFDHTEVLSYILKYLSYYFSFLETGNLQFLKNEYEAQLYRKGKASTFRDRSKATFLGIIQGVYDNGTLRVLLENDITKAYDLKAIELLY